MSIVWEQKTRKKFEQLIVKIPIFMRPIAQEKISKEAERLAQEAQQLEVLEKNLVDAFFKETPFGFHGLMKADMKTVGIDYTKYGYEV